MPLFSNITYTVFRMRPCFRFSMGSNTVYIYEIYSWILCTFHKKLNVEVFILQSMHISGGCDHPISFQITVYISNILYSSIYKKSSFFHCKKPFIWLNILLENSCIHHLAHYGSRFDVPHLICDGFACMSPVHHNFNYGIA